MAKPDPPPVNNDLSGFRCPACDYELTGLREHRCPECGAEFTLESLRQPRPSRWLSITARGIWIYCGLSLIYQLLAFAASASIPLRFSPAHVLWLGFNVVIYSNLACAIASIVVVGFGTYQGDGAAVRTAQFSFFLAIVNFVLIMACLSSQG